MPQKSLGDYQNFSVDRDHLVVYHLSMLTFGDLLSNALHDIKQKTRKKISIIQDELGYAITPPLAGTTIEYWRYRKRLPPIDQVEALAHALISYDVAAHDREWLIAFLQSADHAYPDTFADTIFPPSPNVAPPPSLDAYRPPLPRGFVGRTHEIEAYSEQLANDRFVIISGMAGIGKTALAGMLTKQYTPSFWHTFREASAAAWLYRLSGFAAQIGSADLWQQLETSRLANIAPPSTATCVDALLVCLSQRDCLLCFDDLHLVADDPHIQRFVMKLLDQPIQQRPYLLFTTRQLPRFLLRRYQPTPLAGLVVADAQHLFEARAARMTAKQCAALHAHTGGNATFLNFTLALSQREEDVDRLIGRLASADNVERFLLEEVDDHLSGDERAVMETLAIHHNQPTTNDALAAITPAERVRPATRRLIDQYLVSVEWDEAGRLHSIHAILGDFFRLQMSVSQRQALHQKAANYYYERQPLLAAEQSDYAGAFEQAAQLLVQHSRRFAHRGNAVRALDVLNRLPLDQLTDEMQIDVQTARATCGIVSGQLELAKTALTDAAERLNQQPDTMQTRRAKIKVCQRMGELLEREDFGAALRWVELGLDLTAPNEFSDWLRERAALEMQQAILQMHRGNFGAAMEQLETLVSADLPPHQQTIALYSLSGLCFYTDQAERSEALGRQALAQAIERQQPLLQLRSLTNLGPILHRRGNWSEAIERLEEGVDLARRLGDRRQRVMLLLNLAGVYLDAGRDDAAVELIGTVLAAASELGQDTVVLVAETMMIRAHLLNKQWQAARQRWQQVQQLAERQNNQPILTMLLGFSAEIEQANGNLNAARTSAERAVQQARQLGDKSEQAIHLRTLGKILTEMGRWESAETALRHSLRLLPPQTYDYALSQLALAELMYQVGSLTLQDELLAQATETFRELGAMRELAEIEQT